MASCVTVCQPVVTPLTLANAVGAGMSDFDLIVVGGGIAGSALARSLTLNGLKVLIVERERQFIDRVRGEAMAPWGVPDTRRLLCVN